MLLYFDDYKKSAVALAVELGIEAKLIKVHRFPDQEALVTLPLPLAPRIIIMRTLVDPDSKIIELLLAARAARDLGVAHITLVAPYLCYMRQDTAFQPGQAVSQRVIAELFDNYFDRLITIDPHLHRVTDLSVLYKKLNASALSAAPLMGEFIKHKFPGAFILGPDEESRQWVQAVAAVGGFDYGVANKMRHGDKQVVVHLPKLDVAKRDVVIVDDIISSGVTIIEIARQLQTLDVKSIQVAVTHGLFDQKVHDALIDAGIHFVWTTDAVLHETNAMSVAKLFAHVLLGSESN